MKLFGIALVAAASAQELRRFNAITRMAYTQVTTSFSAKEFSKRIQNYGCHCFPGYTKAAGGSGSPVNVVDGLCKQLARCHKCVDLEYTGMIDVNTGKYNWEVDGSGNIDCSGNVNNAARKALCACDAEYATQMGLQWNDADYNIFFWLAAQNIDAGTAVFDQLATCNAQNSGADGVSSADECCGLEYPDKEPFNTGSKSCCEGANLYNPLLSQCCTGGAIATIGAC